MTLDDDPRWLRFNNSEMPCPCCGKTFTGVFDIGYDHPATWEHGNRAASGLETLTNGDDFLTSDLCGIGEDRYLRCILPIPIVGTNQRFAFGPWGSVTQENYNRYLGEDPDFEGCFSWMVNFLPWIDNTGAVPCDLIPGGEGMRPILQAHSEHPLSELQDTGVTFDQLLDIYEAAGQDVRRHLTSH